MLTRRPLPFLFVMCPECFFLMLFFYGYRACYCSSSFSSSSSFRSSPVYGFSGRPPGGAGCRERSQRSCLRPGGLPSLTRNPGLQRPFRSRRLCRAVACAPGIPAKGRRDVSNCLEHDIYNENLWYESLHSSFFRIIAFRMVNSLRMQATRATFLTFPAVMSRV